MPGHLLTPRLGQVTKIISGLQKAASHVRHARGDASQQQKVFDFQVFVHDALVVQIYEGLSREPCLGVLEATQQRRFMDLKGLA